MSDLSPTAENLWAYLCSCVTSPGKEVALTVGDIAEQRGWPVEVVRRALDELVSAGKLVEDQDGRYSP